MVADVPPIPTLAVAAARVEVLAMLQPATRAAHLRYSQHVLMCVLLALLVLSGCQAVKPPATDPEPVQAPAAPKPLPVPKERPAPSPRQPLRIAILTSCENTEYAAVKDELIALAGPENADLFDLGSSALQARSAVDSLRARGHDNVVAIGLLAARATHRLDVEKVVFCQVMNHADYDLLGPRRQGILALPPLDQAARLWHAVAPSLLRVGVITGPGHEDIIRAAEASFRAHGIELLHRVTSTDKETALEFQRMAPEIQGYWLLPDNRVLSRTAIRDLLSLARRSGIGVLVNDERFLDLGAVISTATHPNDVAQRAHALLLDARGAKEFGTAGMQWPEISVLHVNPDAAAQLGYDLGAAPNNLLAR